MRISALAFMYVAAIVLVSVLAVSSPAQAVVLDRIVALVNNEAITWLELYDAMERDLAPRLKGLSDDERRKVLSSAEAGFLDSMVNKKLQLQEATRKDIYVSDEEVEATVANIRSKYGMSNEEFRKAVEETGAEWTSYRQTLRDQIVIQKLVDKSVKSALEDPEGGSAAAQEGKFHLRQIFLKGDRSEDELLGLVKTVYDALGSGEEFEGLAKRMSEGPNAQSGGDLGTVDESSLSEPMRQALRGVPAGQVAPPVTSGMGVHILKVVSRTSEAGQDREAQFQQAYEYWLKGLRDRASIEIRL